MKTKQKNYYAIFSKIDKKGELTGVGSEYSFEGSLPEIRKEIRRMPVHIGCDGVLISVYENYGKKDENEKVRYYDYFNKKTLEKYNPPYFAKKTVIIK